MKKIVVSAVVVGAIALLGFQSAQARCGFSGGGRNGGACQAVQMDEATQKKFDAFQQATVELRKNMAAKQAEKMALMQGDNPDPAKAAKLSNELFDLRTQLQAKAKEAGLQQGAGQGCGMGGAMAMGGNCSNRGGGPGMRDGFGMQAR